MQIKVEELQALLDSRLEKNYEPLAEDGTIQIAVLQRGFVSVGRFYQHGPIVTLTNSYTIRRWGTTAGLGQLAAEGPTEKTILDAEGTISVHQLAIVKLVECTWAGWPERCA